MNLKYFTREAYTSLKKDLDINKEKYLENNEWIKEYFAEQGIAEYYRESSIIVKDFSLDYSGDSDEEKNKDDLNNIIKFYSAYKDKITPATASDPLLWSALCHIDYKDYILKRWMKDDGSVRLDQRFFATEGRTSLTYYNAIARLWWSGYLTYDENADDPWEVTRTLLSAQQVQKDLFDQSFSMNKDVVKGLLRALKRVQDEKKNACTTLFRACCNSYFNHYGAVTAIDMLTPEDVEKLAYDYMKKTSDGEKNSHVVLKDKVLSKSKKSKKKRSKSTPEPSKYEKNKVTHVHSKNEHTNTASKKDKEAKRCINCAHNEEGYCAHYECWCNIARKYCKFV